MALSPRDVVLVVGSTMRLTRLVVTDDLGRWVVVWPAYRWAGKHNPVPEAKLGAFGVDTSERREWAPTWRDKLVTGLDCPYCVGQWVAFGVLAITAVTRPNSLIGRCWRFVMAGLTTNYVAAHIGSRLGDVAPDPDDE